MDEKERWAKEIQVLKSKGDLLPGDSVIGAGMVAYAGAFTSNYRQELENSWLALLKELGIKHTEGIRMRTFLGVPVLI